jgi:hypothetical protein
MTAHANPEYASIKAVINVSNPWASLVTVDGKILYPVTQVELRCGVDRPTELVLRIPIIDGQIDVEIVEGRVLMHDPPRLA